MATKPNIIGSKLRAKPKLVFCCHSEPPAFLQGFESTTNFLLVQLTRVIPLGVKDLAMVISPPLLTRAPFSRVVVYCWKVMPILVSTISMAFILNRTFYL